ncbi:MAG: LolA family protein [Candidatus Sumerlaeaceae bacterium]
MFRLFRVPAALLSVSLSLLLVPGAAVAEASPETLRALGEVKALSDKVNSFRANLEVRDKQGPQEQVTTSSLSASKDYGWHIRSSSEGSDYEFICDFTNFYQFYPAEKKAYKHTPGPEMQPMLRKPVTDLNPVTLLEPASLKFQGKGDIAGEPVYHFEGTTSTQFLPQGKPVQRKMEAWISAKDGLPRKTIETVGASVGTTVYTNVEINPKLDESEFKFTPAAGVQVIDATTQMKAMEEQEKKAAQQRASGASDAATTAARPQAPSSADEKPKD